MATATAGEVTLSSDAAVVIFDNSVDGVVHKTVSVVNDSASVGKVYLVYTVMRNGRPNCTDLKSGDSIPLAPGELRTLFDQSGHHGFVDKITVTREAGKAATLRFGPGA
jgi:predicted xylose isomerase-like sugar epimerase